ncbi:MAG: Flp pilus assembly complex ATPase component TadA [Candidatus Omnitrophica bacterium]|nr:Flp pilus assembly complex ATPase component TadA [Candidatus Omnitrophota bacterium]
MTALIDALLKQELITREQLDDARDKQLGAKNPIQELIVDMGFISEKKLMQISSKIFNMPVVKLQDDEIDEAAIKFITFEQAKRYGVFPVKVESKILYLAMSDPLDIVTIDDIKLITSLGVKAILCAKAEISEYIKKYYKSDDAVYDLLKNMVKEADVKLVDDEGSSDEKIINIDIVKGADTPVVRLANLILSDAIKSRATDVHIEPQEKIVEVRYRIDGYLKNIMKVPLEMRQHLIARVKIMALLDVAEHRKPQGGRCRIAVANRKVDLRISIMPTFYGEKAAIRLLDTKESRFELGNIGFEEKGLSVFKEEISRSQGMVLVTGPTGSGKTSTLYAALNYIKSETKNIVSIEDPIEYLIDGLNQMQVDPARNVTFANALRSVLRQDPNVILVGEVRDKETAEIAFQASLTGHMVFSTLHTNSAVSSIIRLLNIGLEPFLIASSLVLVVAQRLVRRVCPHCRVEYQPDEKLLKKFAVYLKEYNVSKFFKGKGCKECDYSGYLGRTAIFEVFKINEKIRSLISDKVSEDRIFEQAKKTGLITLANSGIRKVRDGFTTIEEVSNVTDVTEENSTVIVQNGKSQPAKILIVDDEEDILKILRKYFEHENYEVIQAGDGREAIEKAHKDKPDLVVMDVMMPNMDGFKATEILRSRLETATIPIVLLTAKIDKKSEIQGLKAGADDYITKPFDKDKLLARVGMLLKRRGF